MILLLIERLLVQVDNHVWRLNIVFDRIFVPQTFRLNVTDWSHWEVILEVHVARYRHNIKMTISQRLLAPIDLNIQVGPVYAVEPGLEASS